MLFCISKIRTYLFCPRKFILESKDEKVESTITQKINKSGFLKNVSISLEIYGLTLYAKNIDLKIDDNKITIISHRRGKRLYQYHYLEAAGYAFVVSSYTDKKIDVIFKSKYYRSQIPWEKHVNSFKNIIYNFSNKKIPKPILNPECKFCKYSLECTNELIKAKDLSLIRGIGKFRLKNLKEKGIEKLDDIIEMKEVVKEIFGEKSDKIIAQAKAFIQKKIILYNPVKKLKPGIFLDIESYKNFNFLFGVLYEDKYIPFLSLKREDEKTEFKKLISFLSTKKLPVYHYYNYEPIQINKLFKKYNLKKTNIEFVDLYKIYHNHIAIPTISYSLKSIAKYLGFNWRTNLNGNIVVHKFEDFLKTKDDKILDEILKYNEDDVNATKLLFNIVNKLSD
ncbi:TM0106 family RecB-like putative nuclease [Thermosipho sp. 1074]|uniref:TM0106 family RecB-like putative nuclease n=1 Tax=Thermosipho sp. 1074 TaxID=1643331 RepID=UPI000984957A|nr:TM0106 family RecB-like putative nuclease [Thermosipho sp. 1074]OOC42767.1 recombinase RecB [Thermosipho sp. 1074]